MTTFLASSYANYATFNALCDAWLVREQGLTGTRETWTLWAEDWGKEMFRRHISTCFNGEMTIYHDQVDAYLGVYVTEFLKHIGGMIRDTHRIADSDVPGYQGKIAS